MNFFRRLRYRFAGFHERLDTALEAAYLTYVDYYEPRIDEECALNELGREIVDINRANGWDICTPGDWNDDTKIPCKLALIHSETSEALEAFRKDDRDNFIEELADTLIRILDTSSGLGFDIETVVRAKLEKNKTRGFRHGGKRC